MLKLFVFLVVAFQLQSIASAQSQDDCQRIVSSIHQTFSRAPSIPMVGDDAMLVVKCVREGSNYVAKAERNNLSSLNEAQEKALFAALTDCRERSAQSTGRAVANDQASVPCVHANEFILSILDQVYFAKKNKSKDAGSSPAMSPRQYYYKKHPLEGGEASLGNDSNVVKTGNWGWGTPGKLSEPVDKILPGPRPPGGAVCVDHDGMPKFAGFCDPEICRKWGGRCR